MAKTEWGKTLTKIINAAEKAAKANQEFVEAAKELKDKLKKDKQ